MLAVLLEIIGAVLGIGSLAYFTSAGRNFYLCREARRRWALLRQRRRCEVFNLLTSVSPG